MSLAMACTSILIGRPLIGIAVSWFIITNACGYNCESKQSNRLFAMLCHLMQTFFSRMGRSCFENFLIESFRSNQQANLRNIPFESHRDPNDLWTFRHRQQRGSGTLFLADNWCIGYYLRARHSFFTSLRNSVLQIVERDAPGSKADINSENDCDS